MQRTTTINQALFDKYYPESRFEGGTVPFYRMCRENIPPQARILEIGAGPSNGCSQTLSGIGSVTGLDLDPDVKTNRFLDEAVVYDGRRMPFEDASFDACVSNWVLEHVEHPDDHFREEFCAPAESIASVRQIFIITFQWLRGSCRTLCT